MISKNSRAFLPGLFCSIVVLCAIFSINAKALGTPKWAKAHLDDPSPKGSYIARSDHWAVVYGEVCYSTLNGKIRTKYRYILENMTDRSINFSTSIPYDEGVQNLSDMSLNVQREHLWHRINLKRAGNAGKASFGHGSSKVWAWSEDIPAHHRVLWEYTLTGKYDFPPWSSRFISDYHPARTMKFYIASEASSQLKLEMTNPAGVKLPDTFKIEGDMSVTVSRIPSYLHLDDELAYQPSRYSLYPRIIVSFTKGSAESWEAYISKYSEMWNKVEDKTDWDLIGKKAKSITAGCKTPFEKAGALLKFVSTNIIYDDSNEKALNNWVPIAPKDLLRSMKGDCKGKTMLLKVLLKSVGIESAPVMLYLSDGYTAWRDVVAGTPTNHVILAINLPQKNILLPSTLNEGPAKGWVLADPTLRTCYLGDPLPGYEGHPALLECMGSKEPFHIHTKVPSAEITKVKIDTYMDSLDEIKCKISVKTNGSSHFTFKILGLYDKKKKRDYLVKVIRGAILQPQIRALSVDLPKGPDSHESSIDFSFFSSKPVERLSSTCLFSNPLAIASIMAGMPSTLRRRHSVPDKDKVKLSQPWKAHLNCYGSPVFLEVNLDVYLSDKYTWTPPSPEKIEEPWVDYTCTWTNPEKGHYTAKIHLEIPCGSWPAKDRIERLKKMDAIYSSFYAPLILKPAS